MENVNCLLCSKWQLSAPTAFLAPKTHTPCIPAIPLLLKVRTAINSWFLLVRQPSHPATQVQALVCDCCVRALVQVIHFELLQSNLLMHTRKCWKMVKCGFQIELLANVHQVPWMISWMIRNDLL